MKRLLSLAVLAAVAGVTACAKSEEPAPAAEEPVHAAVVATIETIAAQHFSETVDAIGVVSPRPGHVASLAAPGPTRVTAVNTTVGAQVQKGDVLIELERPPFEAAANSADAILIAAQSAATRAQRLADAGVIPRKDAEQTAAELVQARTNAQAAHRALDLATLRAPIDGVVTRESAVLGASVDAGQSLVDVTDVSNVEVALTLSVADARRVSPGQPVALHSGSDATGAPVATGRVLSVSATVDSASLGVRTRIALPEGPAKVRLNETVFGRIVVREHADAIVLPLESLVPDGESAFKVFVVDSAGVAHARTVTVGGRSDHGIWVKDGLKIGERVVTHGAYGVSDGATVTKEKGA